MFLVAYWASFVDIFHCSTVFDATWRDETRQTWTEQNHDRLTCRLILSLSLPWRHEVLYIHCIMCVLTLVILLSAQCISSIGQIIKSVCVSVSQWVSQSHKTSWTLYRSQSSTDLHQTCHQGRVPRDVVTYCFWWISEIFLSAKPEVELILTIAPVEIIIIIIIVIIIIIQHL